MNTFRQLRLQGDGFLLPIATQRVTCHQERERQSMMKLQLALPTTKSTE